MALVLQPDTVDSLREYVDTNVRSEGCDHTHRFLSQWSASNGLDAGEVADVAENYGGYCDCEVVLNLPNGVRLSAAPNREATPQNPWMLPPDFTPTKFDGFTRVLIGTDKLGGSNYHTEGALVIPAPFDLKPKKRIRKLVHYFIGLDSGMPAEVAYVSECDYISADELVSRVAASSVDGLDAFSQSEAAFILTRIASMRPETSVGVWEMEKLTDRGKHEELRIARVMVRR